MDTQRMWYKIKITFQAIGLGLKLIYDEIDF